VLYETYQPSQYYFECVALLRRTMFVLTFTILPLDALTKSQVYVYLALFCLLLHLVARPYCLPRDNAFETVSLFFLTFIVVAQTGRLELEELGAGTQAVVSTCFFCALLVFAFLQLYTRPALRMGRWLPRRLVDWLALFGLASEREVEKPLERERTESLGTPPVLGQSPGADSGVTSPSSESSSNSGGGGGAVEMAAVNGRSFAEAGQAGARTPRAGPRETVTVHGTPQPQDSPDPGTCVSCFGCPPPAQGPLSCSSFYFIFPFFSFL